MSLRSNVSKCTSRILGLVSRFKTKTVILSFPPLVHKLKHRSEIGLSTMSRRYKAALIPYHMTKITQISVFLLYTLLFVVNEDLKQINL